MSQSAHSYILSEEDRWRAERLPFVLIVLPKIIDKKVTFGMEWNGTKIKKEVLYYLPLSQGHQQFGGQYKNVPTG